VHTIEKDGMAAIRQAAIGLTDREGRKAPMGKIKATGRLHLSHSEIVHLNAGTARLSNKVQRKLDR
jgi:hypothetical protein